MEEPVEISRTTPESNPEEGWFHLDVHPPVFFFSAGFILFFVIITLVFQEHMEAVFQQVQASISDYAGWLFIWTVNIVLIFILVLLGGRFGNIRLGGPDAQPEFSTVAWFSMLFSAGMGIGLLFYGVAEPMFHYAANPQAQPGTLDSARWAMDITFLHWGLHPWAIYSLVGLSLGFFAFNKGLPLSIRTAFYPLFGERIYGWVGNVIDILATVATLFGVATSLGLGVQQINAGLDHLLGIGQTVTIQVLLIASITLVATWSVVKGLDKGIRRLSEINISIAALLALFVLLLGPTLFIMNALLENIGYYVQYLLALLKFEQNIEISMPTHVMGVPEQVSIGNSAACIGFPFGYYYIYNQLIQQSVICSKILSKNKTRLFLFDTVVHDGHRGAPLINTHDGRIIGVVGGRFEPQEILPDQFTWSSELPIKTFISYAVSIEHAVELMEKEALTIV